MHIMIEGDVSHTWYQDLKEHTFPILVHNCVTKSKIDKQLREDYGTQERTVTTSSNSSKVVGTKGKNVNIEIWTTISTPSFEGQDIAVSNWLFRSRSHKNRPIPQIEPNPTRDKGVRARVFRSVACIKGIW